MVLVFFDVQSYLQNIDITVAWRTSLCGSPASQTYLMYEAYDQTTQSNLTPGFKPFIVSNSYLIRRKRRCENKQKRKRRTKKHTRIECSFLIVYHAKKKRKRPWMKRHVWKGIPNDDTIFSVSCPSFFRPQAYLF